MGSLETSRLYAIDPKQWTVTEEAQAPGKPFGLSLIGDDVRAIISIGDDDRYIYQFVPGHGFREQTRIACPDFTGSHLAFDGDTLFLSQSANKRILTLDGAGHVKRTIDVPRHIVGMTIVDGAFLLVTADDEFENVCLTRVDARAGAPIITDLATIPFGARGLTWDGSLLWTSHRDDNELVALEYPK